MIMTPGSVSHSTPGSVSVWIHDLREGSEVAARELFDRYFGSVRNIARQQLSNFPTRIVDDEDLALSVIDTLFRGVRHGHFDRMKDRVDLWCLLVVIARQQIIDHKRWESRDKRDVKMVGDTVNSQATKVFDTEPTPHLLAELKDQRQHLFDVLRTDELRYIAAAKLEGYKNSEISQSLGMSNRTVQRKVNQIYERWARELG